MFKVINSELFAVKESGYRLDFDNDHAHIDKSLTAFDSPNRADRDIDSFYDLDSAVLCEDENGEMYAVRYYDDKPYIWQKVVKA